MRSLGRPPSLPARALLAPVSRRMAWRSHGRDNASLVAALLRNGVLKTQRVADAMRSVDRGLFVPPELQGQAYDDAPAPIGYAQTISAPHMHAHCLEELLPWLSPGARALDVGSGSGYLVAVLWRLVEPNGSVVGVELVPQLASRSIEALKEVPGVSDAFAAGKVEVSSRDAWTLGDEAGGGFDAIHVLVRVEKASDGKLSAHPLTGVVYVPLVRKAESEGASDEF